MFGFRRAFRPPPVEPDTYPSVELVSWAPRDGSRNFGDHLSQIVVTAAAQRHGLTLEDETARPARMLAIGSILHFARDGDCVWGSGINGKIALEKIAASTLDIRAVRGPKTAAALRDRGFAVPDVFGDPALLVPHFFAERFPRTVDRDYIIIPNLHDLAMDWDRDRLVSPLRGWNHVISQIVRSDFVIASSLHGIILAEAFGVPARLLRVSETEAPFKYDDHAQGTGRARLSPATSVQNALDMGADLPMAFDPAPLLDAFPADLWTVA